MAAEAVADLRKAQQTDPDYVKASFHLGLVLRSSARALTQQHRPSVDDAVEANEGYWESNEAMEARLKRREEQVFHICPCLRDTLICSMV